MIFPAVIIPVVTCLLSLSIQSVTKMSSLDLDTMKLLLAEQSQNLLSELKAQVKDEVAAQLGPHATRLDTLHDDQVLLKKQLKELTENLLLKANPVNPAPSPPPPAAAPLTDLPLLPPLGPSTLSMEDISSIERECTLNFAPITSDDLDRMKHNQTEEVSTTELLSRTLHDFLDANMNIPHSTIAKMEIKTITHAQEIDFQTVTVEFANMCPVNTIFRYVKNLAPEQKVFISIPTPLEPRYNVLHNHAYQLRNGQPKYRTVIKFIGNDLALYAKKLSEKNWQIVTTQPNPTPLVSQDKTLKRPRDEENDSPDDDPLKKTKKAVIIDETLSDQNKEAEPADADTKSVTKQNASGIPKPSFSTVPCHSKPAISPHQTVAGGFWPSVAFISPAAGQKTKLQVQSLSMTQLTAAAI